MPDGYFACGLHGCASQEYLWLFATEGGRRFAFYDSYVIYMRPQSTSIEMVRGHLHEALRRWDEGAPVVVFSGPWGWWNSEAGDFGPSASGELGQINRLLADLGEAERPPDPFLD